MASLFVYGSLQVDRVLSLVLGHAPLVKPVPAVVSGFERRRVAGRVYPGLIRSSGTPGTGSGSGTASRSSGPRSEVRGMLVRGLTAEDVRRLDVFEGEEYVRQRVVVRVLGEGGGHGGEVEADTYVWASGEVGLDREEWSLERDFLPHQDAWIATFEAGDGGVVSR